MASEAWKPSRPSANGLCGRVQGNPKPDREVFSSYPRQVAENRSLQRPSGTNAGGRRWSWTSDRF
jgi:hypothetical protein